jgi:hypothetical protein
MLLRKLSLEKRIGEEGILLRPITMIGEKGVYEINKTNKLQEMRGIKV